MVWVNAEPGQANTDAGLARRSTVLDSVMDSRYGDTGLEKTQEQHPLQGAKIHSKDFAAWSVKLKQKTTYLYIYIIAKLANSSWTLVVHGGILATSQLKHDSDKYTISVWWIDV